MIDWTLPVVEDYRQRILVDAGHPILAFKANRDRFTKGIYAGYPYLGSRNSEDALVWNVFRTLQLTGRLETITDLFGLLRPAGLLFWSIADDTKDQDLQYRVGRVIRSVDGKRRGQITEPDVVIAGCEAVAVIECKLGEPNAKMSKAWKGSGARWGDYLAEMPDLLNLKDYAQPAYQLIRMLFYARILGRELGLQPVLVSLSNQSSWALGRPSMAEQWQDFVSRVPADVRCVSMHWQQIARRCATGGLDELAHYLTFHPCLTTT